MVTPLNRIACYFNGFLHFRRVTESNGHRVMDHHHGNRGHQNLGTSHCDNGCCGGSDAVNLDRDAALVVHQHIVDLGCRHAVTAGAVDPDRDVAGACHQFILEKLWGDVIVKPTFLGDGAVQEQSPLRRSCLRLCLVLPLPELLHRFFPPFRYR